MNQSSVLDRDKTGENLKKLIQKSGMTYDHIADYLNLNTARVVYDWINGFKLPKIEHLVTLSQLLNVKLEDILVIKDVF